MALFLCQMFHTVYIMFDMIITRQINKHTSEQPLLEAVVSKEAKKLLLTCIILMNNCNDIYAAF